MAEWLRRWTWNPLGFPRAGSNPAGCVKIFYAINPLFSKSSQHISDNWNYHKAIIDSAEYLMNFSAWFFLTFYLDGSMSECSTSMNKFCPFLITDNTSVCRFMRCSDSLWWLFPSHSNCKPFDNGDAWKLFAQSQSNSVVVVSRCSVLSTFLWISVFPWSRLICNLDYFSRNGPRDR